MKNIYIFSFNSLLQNFVIFNRGPNDEKNVEVVISLFVFCFGLNIENF